MKKVLILMIVLVTSFMIFADGLIFVKDSAEIATAASDLKDSIKSLFNYTVMTFLIALISLIFNAINKAINEFVESKRNDKFYQAYKKLEEIIYPIILETEKKIVKDIKKKFPADSPERAVELGKIANETLYKIEKATPESVKKDIETKGESFNGLLPTLFENIVKENKVAKYIDFRKVRDRLNIPKI